MYDILSSKDIIELNDQYDERAKEIFILEKKLMLVDLLRFRGLFNVSNELLSQIINSVNQRVQIHIHHRRTTRRNGYHGRGIHCQHTATFHERHTATHHIEIR